MSWTVSKLLLWSVAQLAKARIQLPRLDSEILLAHALGCSREQILINSDQTVEFNQIQKCCSLVERRVLHEPLNYIIGEKEFWSLAFRVGPGVLIPRPETELLIECLLSCKMPSNPLILDIGTGSGVIAIVSALEIPNSRIIAVDISSSALKMARYNATIHRVDHRINFLAGNIMDQNFCENLGRFDFILANPPYIPTGDLDALMADVKDFEPFVALDGGFDGLDFFRNIAPIAAQKLNSDGFLIMEIGDGQDQMVSKIVERQFSNAGILEDRSGQSRVIFVRKEING